MCGGESYNSIIKRWVQNPVLYYMDLSSEPYQWQQVQSPDTAAIQLSTTAKGRQDPVGVLLPLVSSRRLAYIYQEVRGSLANLSISTNGLCTSMPGNGLLCPQRSTIRLYCLPSFSTKPLVGTS